MFSPGKLYYSMLPVFKVYGVTVIATAVLCLLVAEKTGSRNFGNGSSEAATPLKPLQWFAAILIGWPITFPAFLSAYFGDAKPGRVKAGWVNTALFIICILLLWFIARHGAPQWPGMATVKSKQPPSAAAPHAPQPVAIPPYTAAPPVAAPNAPAASPAPAIQTTPRGNGAVPPAIPGATPQVPVNQSHSSQKGNRADSPGAPSFGLAVLQPRGQTQP